MEAARRAGELVAERFGGPLEVMQKAQKEGVDVVTDVDKASQELIESVMKERFPDHQLLGEEDPPDEEPPAADFMWVVDPIDGTKNFINGSPVHAVSVALLHRGIPVAAAIWTPWPANGGHALVHGRRGGGTWLDGKRLSLEDHEDGQPKPGRLTVVPGSLGAYQIDNELRQNMGETRVTGSTCYEMLMVATGSAQFAISGFAHTWDFAAGMLLIKEAGGRVMSLNGDGRWQELEGWGLPYLNDADTSQKMRKWMGPVLSGPPKVTEFAALHSRLRRESFLARALKTFTGR